MKAEDWVPMDGPAIKKRLKRPKNLPRHAWRAVRKALALDPTQRCISAAQLRTALATQPGFFARFL